MVYFLLFEDTSRTNLTRPSTTLLCQFCERSSVRRIIYIFMYLFFLSYDVEMEKNIADQLEILVIILTETFWEA